MADKDDLLEGIFVVSGAEHAYAKKSCCCLGSNLLFRKLCVIIMVNTWFDRFITFCIILNSILLASKEYEENYDPTYKSSWNETLE